MLTDYQILCGDLKHFCSPQPHGVKENSPKYCHASQLKTEASRQFLKVFVCLIYSAEVQTKQRRFWLFGLWRKVNSVYIFSIFSYIFLALQLGNPILSSTVAIAYFVHNWRCNHTYRVYVARFWEWRVYRGAFCEKMLEASPMSDRVNVSWLQDGPAAGQGRPHQRRC